MDYTNIVDTVELFYNPLINRFENEDGEVVEYVFDYITPNDLYLFWDEQREMIILHRDRKDVAVELYFPSEEDHNFCANYWRNGGECPGDNGPEEMEDYIHDT